MLFRSREIDLLVDAYRQYRQLNHRLALEGGKPVVEAAPWAATRAKVEAIWEAIREPLSSNGLAVIQTTGANPTTGLLELVTTLAHSSGQQQLLARLQQARSQSNNSRILVGQSRLLTRAGDSHEAHCRMCGHCSSGCVYGSIYTAEQEINRWIRDGSIDYRGGVTVFRLEEQHGTVRIHYVSADRAETLDADRVFVATGAVNSARLLLNSSPMKLDSAVIRRTGYTVQIYASPSSLAIDWPNVNTQTSHFLALQHPETAPYWAHVQLGQPNELILKRLGLRQSLTDSGVGDFNQPILNAGVDLIAYTPKLGQLLFVSPGRGRRIVERPKVTL